MSVSGRLSVWLIKCTGKYDNISCSDRILIFGIRSIRSPAKVGIGYYKAVNYQPDS